MTLTLTLTPQVTAQIVKLLSQYRKPNIPVGRITNDDDFKHLARKVERCELLSNL